MVLLHCNLNAVKKVRGRAPLNLFRLCGRAEAYFTFLIAQREDHLKIDKDVLVSNQRIQSNFYSPFNVTLKFQVEIFNLKRTFSMNIHIMKLIMNGYKKRFFIEAYMLLESSLWFHIYIHHYILVKHHRHSIIRRSLIFSNDTVVFMFEEFFDVLSL